MASANYLDRIQQVEIRTQATNNTTAQLLYSLTQRWGENQITNHVYIIDIYLWCLHSKYLTSTSDVSQKSTTSDRRHW